MPVSGFANSGGAGANFVSETISCEIGGIYCGPYAYASGFRPVGARPGYAMITISHAPAEVARKAKEIVLNLAGPAGNIQVGPQVVCKRRTNGASPVSELLFVGHVAIVEHDLDADSLLVIALDQRWQLMDIRVEGSYVINALPTDDDEAPEYYYVEGQPPIFNPGGRANGRRLSNGIKVFTPWPDMGLVGDEEPGTPDDPETEDVDEQVALDYWTLGDIVDYLWHFYGPDADLDALLPSFPWMKKCPEQIVWPKGMASAVDQGAQENFNAGRGQGNQKVGTARKGREVNLDGLGVLDAIQQMLETAGGYTLALEAAMDDTDGSGEFRATSYLSIVPSMFRNPQHAVQLEVAAGGQAQETLTRPMIQGGRFSEDGSDYVNRLAGVGDRVRIERRATTELVGDTVQLRPRWSSATSLAARTKLAQPVNQTQQGLANTYMEYETWLAEYELAPEWDFQEGTSEEGRSRLPAPRAILPRLLSFMGSDRGPRDLAALTYAIRAEVKIGSTWTPVPELDGLEILDDGGIRMPRLRQDALNWHWTAAPFEVGPDDGVKITEREIRMTLAIPCDHRCAAVASTAWKKGVGEDADEVVDSVDTGRIDLGLDRVSFKNLRGLYRKWLRKDSWPVPQSFFAAITQAEDKTGTGTSPLLVDDVPMLKAHVRHALEMAARLRKSGTLVFKNRICLAWGLGTQVDWFTLVGGPNDGAQFPGYFAVNALLWSNEPDATRTELHPG